MGIGDWGLGNAMRFARAFWGQRRKEHRHLACVGNAERGIGILPVAAS